MLNMDVLDYYKYKTNSYVYTEIKFTSNNFDKKDFEELKGKLKDIILLYNSLYIDMSELFTDDKGACIRVNDCVNNVLLYVISFSFKIHNLDELLKKSNKNNKRYIDEHIFCNDLYSYLYTYIKKCLYMNKINYNFNLLESANS